jgi:hypothetical protein
LGDGGPEGPSGAQESESVLHAKYHDYCSAQLADLLLFLSSDEIYLLAKRAQDGSGEGGEVASYADMVRFATQWLSERVPLPPYEVWLEDYRRNPESYDEYLMGLWESELEAEGPR